MEWRFLLKTFWASNFLLYGYVIFLILWKMRQGVEYDIYNGSFSMIFDGVMLVLFVILEIVTVLYCVALWHAHRLSLMYNSNINSIFKELENHDHKDG